MMSTMEECDVINLTRGKVGNTRDVAKHAWNVYRVEVSDVIVLPCTS